MAIFVEIKSSVNDVAKLHEEIIRYLDQLNGKQKRAVLILVKAFAEKQKQAHERPKEFKNFSGIWTAEEADNFKRNIEKANVPDVREVGAKKAGKEIKGLLKKKKKK